MLKTIKKKQKRSLRTKYKLLKCSYRTHAIRLIFKKSNRYLYLSAVSKKGVVLQYLTTSTLVNSINKCSISAASVIGEQMGKIMNKNYPNEKFFFDRGCYKYQGKVKICADAARKQGLNF